MPTNPPKVGEDGRYRRTWIVIHRFKRAPIKKSPPQNTTRGIDNFLRELMHAYPGDAKFTVVSLTWDHDIDVQDGHERIMIAEECAV